MNKQQQLAKAIQISSLIHLNQFDRGGKPYILHPLHLMNQLLYDYQLATIAVLHDVIEDGSITIEELKNIGFSLRVTTALDLLTHREEDTYEVYIEKICTNYDSIRVKRKDIGHNSDVTRLKGITEKDLKRIEKYHRAYVRLTEAKRTFERN